MRHRLSDVLVAGRRILLFLMWQRGMLMAEEVRYDSSGDALPSWAVMRLGTSRLRHGGPVSAVTFSRSGSKLASASWDGTLSIWENETGRELVRCTADVGEVYCVAFAPDERTIASGAQDGVVRIWDAATGKGFTSRKSHDGWSIRSLQFSPDGRYVASGGDDNTVSVWRLGQHHASRVLRGQSRSIQSVAFSHAGDLLAAGSLDGTVRVWDTATWKAVKMLRARMNVKTLAFSPSDRMLAVGTGSERIGSDGRGVDLVEPALQVWEIGTQMLLKEIRWGERTWAEEGVETVTFIDDERVALGERHAVHLLHWRSCKDEWQYDAGASVWALAVTADSRRLAVATPASSLPIVGVADGKRVSASVGHEGRITGIDVSADGKLIVSVAFDLSTRVWSPETGHEVAVRRWDTNLIKAVRFVLGDGTVAVAMGKKGEAAVRLWDTEKNVLEEMARFKGVLCLDAAAAGSMIAAGGDDEAPSIWDVASRKRLATFQSDPGFQIVLSRDGRRLAVRQERRLVIWDCATRRRNFDKEIDPTHADSCAFLWSGGHIVVAGETSGVALWDVKTATRTLQFKSSVVPVLTLASTADARYVAAGCGDFRVRLWDAANGDLVAAVQGHRGPVDAVAFLPGELKLVSAGNDSSMLIWDIASLIKQRGDGGSPTDKNPGPGKGDDSD